jgi:hypothetical protein
MSAGIEHEQKIAFVMLIKMLSTARAKVTDVLRLKEAHVAAALALSYGELRLPVVPSILISLAFKMIIVAQLLIYYFSTLQITCSTKYSPIF